MLEQKTHHVEHQEQHARTAKGHAWTARSAWMLEELAQHDRTALATTGAAWDTPKKLHFKMQIIAAPVGKQLD